MSKAKKFLSVAVTATTIVWSMGLPSLVAALSVTAVTVSPTSAEITFDGPVQMLPGTLTGANELGAPTTAANDLRNLVFKTGDPLATRNLSRFDPYNMTTQDLIDASNKMRIYGLQSLKLQEGNAFQLQIPANTIRHKTETTTYVDVYNVTDVVGASVDPIVNYITNTQGGDTCLGYPCANVGDEVTFSGTNFATSTDAVQVLWRYGEGSSATSTASSVNATTLITTVPTGVSGKDSVNVTNLTPDRSSDFRPFIVWNSSTQAVIIGSVTSTTAADVDQMEVRAYQSGQMGNSAISATHTNGKYALLATAAGTYNVEFITPAGTTKVAPSKVSGQTVTIGSKTTIAEQTFVAPTLTVTVTDEIGTTYMEGVEVNAYTYDWTVSQKAITAANGVAKLYVPNTSNNQCYMLEAMQRDYHLQRLSQNKGTGVKCLSLNETGTYTMNLTTKNVTGTLKTPAGASSANPYPDTAVLNAGVGLHTLDWSYSQWTNTDSSGNFAFGGATGGTNYVLEIEAPYTGNFAGYPRTTITGITINNTGTTNLNNDSHAVSGAMRFTLPNVFGIIKCGVNVVANAQVQLYKESSWFSTNTDNSGSFKFGGVSVANGYTLSVTPPTGSACASTSFSVNITSATSNDLGNKSLSTLNVSGYVKDPTGTTGQNQAWLSFCPYQNPGQCYGTSTGQDGSFSLNVPDGSWYLDVNPSWGSIYAAPQRMVVTVSGISVTEFLDPGSALTITNNVSTILLSDPSVDGLTGRVCLPGTSEANCANSQQAVGVANIGVNLRVAGQMGGSQWWSNTDANGYYAIGGVAAGSYEVEANPYSGCGQTACSRKVATITITSSSSSRTKNLILSAPNITGTVYISSTTTTPVANAWVNFHIESQMGGSGGWYGANTNELGQFSFGGVTAGTYTLEIEPPKWGDYADLYRQYTTKRYTGIEVSAAVAAGTENLALGNRYLGVPQIVGRVMNPGPDGVGGNADDQPLQWSWVMVHDQMWTNQGGGSTDDAGYFRIGGLTNATGLSMEINLPWGGEKAYVQPAGLTVDVVNDVGVVKLNTVQQNNNLITLTTPKKTLIGTVTKKGTVTAVPNARVEANRDMGGGHFEILTDANGKYTLQLSGGGWWVNVRPDWNMAQPDWVYNESPKRISFAENDTEECRGTLALGCPAGATILGGAENFEVQVANATISGLVKDPTGQTAMANAWVQANSGGMMGPGSGGNTDSSGRFTFKVPAGTYELVANPNWSEQGQNYAASTPTKIKAVADQSTEAGTLLLKSKNSHIKGTVTDTTGNPVGSVMVNAWQQTGYGWANTMSDASTGRFDLKVNSGTWGVMVMPMSTQYVYQGGPQQITVTDNQTSDNNDFLLKVAEGLLKVTVKDADGNRVSDIWGGVMVKDTTANDFLDFGKPEMMQGTSGSMGGGMEKGGFAGGGLMNGYTEIKVPLGSYRLGLGTPPGSKYTLTTEPTLTLDASDTCGTTTKCEAITLTVAPNNATIQGRLYVDQNNNALYDAGTDTVVTGVRAYINGTKSGGGWSMTEFAPSSADDQYELKVAPGNWYVDAFIDPMMSFGVLKYKVAAEDVTTEATAATPATRNFRLIKLDKTISGTVKDPDGLALAGVWVFVDYGSQGMLEEYKGPGLGIGVFSASDGTYTLNVADGGNYKVGAGMPPWDNRDLINPDLQSVTLSGSNKAGIDLQFGQSDATITGNVTLNSANKKAMINAWSDSNHGTGVFTDSGVYTLKVKSGEAWHVKATTKGDDGKLYESAVADLTTVAGVNTKNLTLVSKNIDVPDSKTTTFSASDSKTIELSDGLKVEIPAGALGSTGNITVTVTPTVELEETSVKADSKDKPIGLNYDFVAKNSSGQEISSFNQDVKITFPYSETLITEAGYAESDALPKYYDDTTGTWENYKAVVRDATNNKVTVTTDHFTAGGMTGGSVSTSGTGSTGNTGGTGGGGSSGLVGPRNLSLKINDGAAKTTSRNIILSINAAYATEMMVSNDINFPGVIWETYNNTRAWVVTSGTGEKTVYVRFRDDSNNLSSIISAVINYEEVSGLQDRDLVVCPKCTTQKGAVYMILGGKKHVFPHLNVYLSWGYPTDFSSVKTVTPTELAKYADGLAVPFRDGSLFRGTAKSLYGYSASAVFVVSNGRLRPIKSSAIYQKLFNDSKWKLVTWVPDDLLSKFEYPLGTVVESAEKHPDGSLVKYEGDQKIYLVESGKKRWLSWRGLIDNGYAKAPIITILSTETYEDAGAVSGLAEDLITPKFIAAAFKNL